jgi:acetyl esterase
MRIVCLLFCLLFFHSSYSQNGIPSAADIREAIAEEIKSFNIAPIPLYNVTDDLVITKGDSVKVRRYYAGKASRQPVIFFIHGGALVAGDLETHDNICRVLAERTKAIVVAIDYKRPPESPYPAGLNDCSNVLAWIKKKAASWGGDPNNIIVVGDSGGGLLATSLQVKEGKNAGFKKMILVNPATDLRNPGEGLYGLVTQLYLNGTSPDNPVISPITAKSFAAFPPTLIITCEKDILKEHGTQLQAKLQQAKVRVKLVDIPAQDHLGGLWAAAHPDAKIAIDETVSFISGTAK